MKEKKRKEEKEGRNGKRRKAGRKEEEGRGRWRGRRRGAGRREGKGEMKEGREGGSRGRRGVWRLPAVPGRVLIHKLGVVN